MIFGNDMIRDIKEYLHDVLTENELNYLRKINKSEEDRQVQLRAFFHLPKIFQKIKETVDPTWLSTQIFINGKHYEF